MDHGEPVKSAPVYQKQEDMDMLFLLLIFIMILFGSSGRSEETYEDSYEESDSNTALGIGAIILGASMLDSAYKREAEAEVERQRLLEEDPMAEFRI